jgi:hypothetical protein
MLTGNNSNEDTYFKDFMDKLENKPEVAEELGIIWDSSKCNIPNAPQEKENNTYLGNVGLIKLFIIWIMRLSGSMRTRSSSRLTSL